MNRSFCWPLIWESASAAEYQAERLGGISGIPDKHKTEHRRSGSCAAAQDKSNTYLVSAGDGRRRRWVVSRWGRHQRSRQRRVCRTFAHS